MCAVSAMPSILSEVKDLPAAARAPRPTGHRVVGATERLETHELERRVREDQPGEPLEAGRPLPRARTLPEPFAGRV